MQLEQSLIRDGLCHADPKVRAYARYWFRDKMPALAPRTPEITRAYDLHGLSSLALLRPAVCDENLLDWILEQSTRDFGLMTIEDYQPYHVWQWLVKAEHSLVARRMADIKRAAVAWHERHQSVHTQLSVVSQLEFRLHAAQLGPEECFGQIHSRCARIDSLPNAAHPTEYSSELGRLEAILEVAAQGPYGERVLDHLKYADANASGHELVAMMDLAALMKLEDAAPIALRLAETEWERLWESIANYFVISSCPKLQALVSESFDDCPWDQQLYLCSVFEADYSLTAASFLRQHLQVAIDRERQCTLVTLAQALAFQFCVEDVETLGEIYFYDPRDPKLIQLAETLYVLDQLGDFNFPYSHMWKGAAAKARELAEAARQLGQFEQRVRIGRNDPCPCGSGKKYKKCCGNAQ